MSNKFSKLAVLSLLGVLALTGCDSSSSSEIQAKPSNYEGEIVTIEGVDEKIHNNILKIIYDAMRDGSVASKTLDKVLYQYAQSIYGSYNALTLSDNEKGTTSLKEAAEEIDRTNGAGEANGVADQFIRDHKVYWTYNDEGKHVDDQGQEVKDDKSFTPSVTERKRALSRYNTIETRIAENFFSKISTGSYSEKHFFNEDKFVKSLYEDGKDVAHYKAVEDEITPIIIDYTFEGEDVFTGDQEHKALLHRDYYQSNYELEKVTEEELKSGYHYVEKEIVPAIYNDLLVEQYLLEEEDIAVKNSYARQINVIRIEKYNDFQINADLLVKELVKEIYSTVPKDEENYLHYVDDEKNDENKENNPFKEIFKKYEKISKGLYDEIQKDADAKAIVDRIHASRSDAFRVVTGESTGKKYYANTTYGDLVKEYEKLEEATTYEEIDQDLLSKFTSNGTVTKEEGFDQAVIDIEQTQAITKGWYVKKQSPSLDSNGTINSKLFEISIANSKLEIKSQEDSVNLAKLAETDRIEKVNGHWQARAAEVESAKKNPLCSINGAFFLKFDGNYSGDDYKNDIVYDDGNAYYIVQVLEAAKEVKLRNSSSDYSYAKTRSPEFLEKVIAEVTKKVAETGNYSSLSKEHWLEQMSIKYHDQVVYDYFKSNYPDLFD